MWIVPIVAHSRVTNEIQTSARQSQADSECTPKGPIANNDVANSRGCARERRRDVDYRHRSVGIACHLEVTMVNRNLSILEVPPRLVPTPTQALLITAHIHDERHLSDQGW
jgi:hypothetical protein